MSTVHAGGWIALFGLLACDPSKPEAVDTAEGDGGSDGAASAWYPDDDGDGYGSSYADPVFAEERPAGTEANAEDCNDDDPDIRPGGIELCNRKDDDCDGEIDEDPEIAGTFYEDDDGDDYGDPDSEPVRACEQPDGYASNNDDCDDFDDSVHPDADENCINGIDDDCDDSIDEDDSGEVLYPDLDEDGWGADDGAIPACSEPDYGYVPVEHDCDDMDPTVFPGAFEYCDGVDNDCDGEVDTDGESQWFRDGDGDGYGADPFSVDGCDPPVDGVLLPGDCEDSDPEISPGAMEICENDIDEDCDTVDSSCDFWGSHGFGEADAALYCGEVGAQTAHGLASAGDTDGDGSTDFWIGAQAGGADRAGRVYLVEASKLETGVLSDVASATLTGRSGGVYAGVSISSPGDLDEDGYPEVWIGSHYDRNEGDESVGSVSLVFGPFEGESSLRGTAESGELGGRLAMAGDTDGDGQQEVALNDYFYVSAGLTTGAVFLLTELPADGDYLASDVAEVIPGDSDGMALGTGIAAMGDVNDDGYDDLALGASDDSEGAAFAGAIYIIEGPMGTLGTVADATAKWMGTEVRQSTAPVAGGHDMDGDGHLDLAVGGWYGESEYPGATYILRGPFEEGTHSLADADATFMGESISDEAGRSLEMLADANGDGLSDLLIGAPGVEDSCGAAYVVLGAAFE